MLPKEYGKPSGKILLTGGNGFIGKNIIESLGSRYDIIAPRSYELDLTNESAVGDYLRKNMPELVIHAASTGVSAVNQEDVQQRNLKMFYSLVRSKKHYRRMIVLGSGAEYDKRRNIASVKEEDDLARMPSDPYGFSKYAMAQYAKGADFVTHLRLFGVFGKYENYAQRFISNIICTALMDLPITIRQNACFDYLYIDDFIRILEMFIQGDKLAHKVYNIGRGKSVELLSIAKMILEIMDRDVSVNILKDGYNQEYSCNIERLKEQFPGLAFTGLRESIQEMVEWYRGHINGIDRNILMLR